MINCSSTFAFGFRSEGPYSVSSVSCYISGVRTIPKNDLRCTKVFYIGRFNLVSPPLASLARGGDIGMQNRRSTPLNLVDPGSLMNYQIWPNEFKDAPYDLERTCCHVAFHTCLMPVVLSFFCFLVVRGHLHRPKLWKQFVVRPSISWSALKNGIGLKSCKLLPGSFGIYIFESKNFSLQQVQIAFLFDVADVGITLSKKIHLCIG